MCSQTDDPTTHEPTALDVLRDLVVAATALENVEMPTGWIPTDADRAFTVEVFRARRWLRDHTVRS
jgi:hypothetical protein